MGDRWHLSALLLLAAVSFAPLSAAAQELYGIRAGMDFEGQKRT